MVRRSPHPGYSVLFPPVSAALTPQLAAGLAATATAALFEPLARRHFGPDAWLGALWFGAATATNLFTGRLAFAFGLLPAVATALALQRGRPRLACALGFITALCSPVAALFAALAGGAYAIGSYIETRRGAPRKRRWYGSASLVALASLAPVAAAGDRVPGGWHRAVHIHDAVAASTDRRRDVAGDAQARIRRCEPAIVLYIAGCILAYAITTAVGSNAARLGALVAGPLARCSSGGGAGPRCWCSRRCRCSISSGRRRSATSAPRPATRRRPPRYYAPAAGVPEPPAGPAVPRRDPVHAVPLGGVRGRARGSRSRGGGSASSTSSTTASSTADHLTAATYEAWLHKLAVRFVGVADATLDYSGRQGDAH